MVIFHAVSVYQLLNLLLYKEKKYEDMETCLVIRDILLQKVRKSEALKKYFSKTVVYTDYWSGKSIDEQEAIIIGYYDKLLADNEVDMEHAEDIIIGCAHNTFGMYASIKNYRFIFLEDAAGLASRYWILDQINVKQLALKYELICKWGLITGKGPAVKRILCDYQAQDENFEPEEDVHIDFCVTRELGNLDVKKRTELMTLFTDIETLELPENSLVLLTQHFANLRTLSFEEQIFIYQTFMDYYVDDENVVIKPHPDDLMYYPMLFPKTSIVREKFPAEFLPFIATNVPKCIATISSTSIFSLRSCFDNKIELGTTFEKDFVKVHRYYCMVKLLESLDDNILTEFYGVNEIALKNMSCYKSYANTMSFKDGKRILCVDVIDDDFAEYLNNHSFDAYIFLNCDDSYGFSYKCGEIEDLWDHIYAITLKKEKLRDPEDGILMSIDDEVIYLHTKDVSLLKKVKEFTMEKRLENSNIIISTEEIVTPEQERIRVLEGMLKATEKKLEYYITRVNELSSDK